MKDINDQKFIEIGGKKYEVVERLKRDPRSYEAIMRECLKLYNPGYAEILKLRDKKTNARRGDRSKEYKARAAKRSRSMSGPTAKFVAIDSEGRNFGPPIDAAGIVAGIDEGSPILAAMKNAKTFQDQRTVLWGASDGEKTDWLHHDDERPLSAVKICEWLTSLPEKYGRNSIFISFGFSYDATQILRDMSFDKASEVLGRKTFDKALIDALQSNEAIEVDCDDIAPGDEECDPDPDCQFESN
jgi:hypothetical protein